MRVSQSIRVSMARRYFPKSATICVIACIIQKIDMLWNQKRTPWNQMLLAARSSQQQMMQTTSRGSSSSSHKTSSHQSTIQETTETTTTNSINTDSKTTTLQTPTTNKTGTTTTEKATTNNMQMSHSNRIQCGPRKNERKDKLIMKNEYYWHYRMNYQYNFCLIKVKIIINQIIN